MLILALAWKTQGGYMSLSVFHQWFFKFPVFVSHLKHALLDFHLDAH